MQSKININAEDNNSNLDLEWVCLSLLNGLSFLLEESRTMSYSSAM